NHHTPTSTSATAPSPKSCILFPRERVPPLDDPKRGTLSPDRGICDGNAMETPLPKTSPAKRERQVLPQRTPSNALFIGSRLASATTLGFLREFLPPHAPSPPHP